MNTYDSIYSTPAAQGKALNNPTARQIADRFTRIERQWCLRERRWRIWAYVDNESIELSGAQLISFQAFRAAAIEQEAIYLPPLADADWEKLVERRVGETAGEWTL